MDDDWAVELNFEYIDWNDITDAELSGDQAAMERLMNQSQEIRRQNSVCETPKATEPTCCISTPRDTMPFEEFLKQENRNPKFVNSAPPKTMQHTPFMSRNALGKSSRLNSSSSYAQITRGAGKAGKRRTNERFGLSPADLPRRKNFRQLLSPPPPPHANTSVQMTTPDTLPVLVSELGEDSELCMDTSTPESDRLPRPGGVQRRLFGGQTSTPQQQQQPPQNEKNGCPPTWQSTCNPGNDMIHKLSQRQRQIDMGKETTGYEHYSQLFPKWKRSHNHPWTPDKNKSCSTRAWQGQMKQWRRNLHKFDPPTLSTTCTTSSSQDQHQFTSEDAALCGLSLDSNENPLDV